MRIDNTEKAPGSKKQRVVFDDGTVLSLYQSDLKRLEGLAVDGEISKAEFDGFIDEVILPRAKNRALHLVSKMDRTEADVRRKLNEGGYTEEVTEHVLSFMKEYHYIDDLSFAKSFIRTYMDTKSLSDIRRRLYEKGVKKAVISEAEAEAYQGDEKAIIEKLLQKKDYDREAADPKEKAKISRFLLSKGFSYDSFSDMI